MGKLVHAAFAAFTIAGSVIYANAQTARNSVSGAEVNGTYRMPFTGKFKDSSNEIRILALGKGKVRVAFDLLYPYMMSDGGPMVNLGTRKALRRSRVTRRFSRRAKARAGSQSNLPVREL
jgi:hypothetical protein